MKIDLSMHDGELTVVADKHRGIWASQTFLRASKTVRAGGQLPTTASAHTLLVAGLTATLLDISKFDVKRILEISNRPTSKPRLVISTANKSFANALAAMIKNDKATRAEKPLRTGKNFLRELARQLARFDVTFRTIGDEESVDVNLRRWAKSRLRDPKMLGTIPPILTATVVGGIA
jgi:hypothetical protein